MILIHNLNLKLENLQKNIIYNFFLSHILLIFAFRITSNLYIMKIRYLDNIHNLNNFYSIVKGGTANNCIHLTKDECQYSLEFLNTDARDYILKTIWDEWEKGTGFFDIDALINTYYDAKRYNL